MSDEITPRKPLLRLIAHLPALLIEQVKNELEKLKLEMVEKLKYAGIGIGLLAGAAFFGLFLFAVLLTAAVLGLATIMPAWLAALIVAVILIVIVVVLVLFGLRELKKGTPPAPTETIANVRKDLNALKGVGESARP